jgi:hypothetical protein
MFVIHTQQDATQRNKIYLAVIIINIDIIIICGSIVVKAAFYKPESRGFYAR